MRPLILVLALLIVSSAAYLDGRNDGLREGRREATSAPDETKIVASCVAGVMAAEADADNAMIAACKDRP